MNGPGYRIEPTFSRTRFARRGRLLQRVQIPNPASFQPSIKRCLGKRTAAITPEVESFRGRAGHTLNTNLDQLTESRIAHPARRQHSAGRCAGYAQFLNKTLVQHLMAPPYMALVAKPATGLTLYPSSRQTRCAASSRVLNPNWGRYTMG